MAWSEALTGFFTALKKGMDRYWGNQTKEMDSLEAQLDHAAEEKRKCLDARPPDVDGANRWQRQLTRLRHEIAARRP